MPTVFLATLAGLSVLWSGPRLIATVTTASVAAPFQRIEQPISSKALVMLGGIGLIGLELWWFIFYKTKAYNATTKGEIQEVTVIVDGGYEPSQIIVQSGHPVRLNFDRRDPSSCLEEVRFPEFRIVRQLPLDQVTSIEIKPEKPGQYEFTCGMNMFRGVLNVQDETTEPLA
jgi:plastocyanin domain-containing protein